MTSASRLHLYALALGSNRPRSARLTPTALLATALDDLARADVRILARARPIESAPVGPSKRRFANGAAIVETPLAPPALLALLKAIERRNGRRPGQRWAARSLDLDIILWSGGIWRERRLCIPHTAFRDRAFVLGPLAQVAGGWRDPLTGLAVRHLHARLGKHRARG